ncbi:hypothetical protein DAPPUDRAFT_238262 [Daphnia pulex]|uniref:Uncharacterized protein n=1 Tax=Daphnia pulex TaxID=6669 RepID=E9G5Y9_DAPPU|nr:hypothetical protein DAPPUDRAFT_238262 [Daphnia pulex]|eukprot:EFX84847.1 hypothetical protein DAPPUDRAFT_238262 [Daphnia pulex]
MQLISNSQAAPVPSQVTQTADPISTTGIWGAHAAAAAAADRIVFLFSSSAVNRYDQSAPIHSVSERWKEELQSRAAELLEYESTKDGDYETGG